MVILTGEQRMGMKTILMKSVAHIRIMSTSSDETTKRNGITWIQNWQEVKNVFFSSGVLDGNLKAILVESLTNDMKKHIGMIVWFARQNLETIHPDYVRKSAEYNTEIVEEMN